MHEWYDIKKPGINIDMATNVVTARTNLSGSEQIFIWSKWSEQSKVKQNGARSSLMEKWYVFPPQGQVQKFWGNKGLVWG